VPPWLSGVLCAAMFLTLATFWARQLTVGGRWGQRPAAQRTRALGAVLFSAGPFIAAAGLLLHTRATIPIGG